MVPGSTERTTSQRAEALGRSLATAVAVTGLALGTWSPASAQEVTLPLAAWQELRARGEAEPPPPAAPLAFEGAHLEVEVGEEAARVTQELTVTLLDEGWQTLELPAAGTFTAAELDGLEGYFDEPEAGQASLRLRGAGRHHLRLTSAVPLERDEEATRDTLRLRLPLPAAAVVTGALRLPAGLEEVEAAGEAILRRGAEGSWRFLAPPGATLELALRGAAAAPESASLPLRFEAVSATAVYVRRTRLEVETWIEARVLQGRLEGLSVPLPPGLEPVLVEGEAVAGWDVAGGRLEIAALRPQEESFAVRLELTGAPAAELASPLPAPRGAERARFFTRVYADDDGLLTLLDAGSGRSLEEVGGQAPPVAFLLSLGRALAVTAPERPPRWKVEWAEGVEVLAAQVHRLLMEVLAGEDGRAYAQIWLEASGSGTRWLAVTPPPGFEPVAARRGGAPLTPGREGAALVLPLAGSRQRQVFYLAGLLPLALPPGGGRLEVPLPALSAPVGRVEVRLLLPGSGWDLAEPARTGSVASPPETAVEPESGWLAGRIATAVPEHLLDDQALLPLPPGFEAVEAAWDALSPAPPPLLVEAAARRPGKEWF